MQQAQGCRDDSPAVHATAQQQKSRERERCAHGHRSWHEQLPSGGRTSPTTRLCREGSQHLPGGHAARQIRRAARSITLRHCWIAHSSDLPRSISQGYSASVARVWLVVNFTTGIRGCARTVCVEPLCLALHGIHSEDRSREANLLRARKFARYWCTIDSSGSLSERRDPAICDILMGVRRHCRVRHDSTPID